MKEGETLVTDQRALAPSTPAFFPAFNGLRFLAALAVVAFHYSDPEHQLHSRYPYVSNVLGSGATSLGFFFILSGFVLAHASRHRSFRGAKAQSAFWLARFARLYPVYLLAFILFAPIAVVKYLRLAHHPALFASAALANLFAIQAWTPLAISWNGPSWSLSVEAFFYGIFPFVYHPIMTARRWTLLLLCGTGWLFEIGLITTHQARHIDNHFWHVWVQYNPVFWVPLFLMGICLYRGLGAWERLPGAVASVISLLATAGLLWWASMDPGFTGDLLSMGGAAPLFALLILSFAHPGNKLNPLLSGSFLTQAGAASYTLYILQAPLEHYFSFVTGTRHVHAALEFTLLCVFLVLVSLTVHRWFEQPAKDWIMQRSKGGFPSLLRSKSKRTVAEASLYR